MLRGQDVPVCFVDQNPHLQGTFLHNRLVVPPKALPDEVTVLYVGLNPLTARNIIENIPALKQRTLDYFFL
jgi:hypothetical protein